MIIYVGKSCIHGSADKRILEINISKKDAINNLINIIFSNPHYIIFLHDLNITKENIYNQLLHYNTTENSNSLLAYWTIEEINVNGTLLNSKSAQLVRTLDIIFPNDVSNIILDYLY